jgi:hypothetical protein
MKGEKIALRLGEISGSRGGKYEDDSRLGRCAVYSGRN